MRDIRELQIMKLALLIAVFIALGASLALRLVSHPPDPVHPTPRLKRAPLSSGDAAQAHDRAGIAIPAAAERSPFPGTEFRSSPSRLAPALRQRAEVAKRSAAPPEPTVAAKPAQPPSTPPSPRKGELAAPVARVALGFVGAVPEAEGVWLAAINDPSIPADERKDLIEDLNEEGFPNPRNLTPDDLPLVQSRLRLIEQYGLEPMDQTNAAAFAEAYKDLINMRDRLEQR
jgi:hypothetical protein